MVVKRSYRNDEVIVSEVEYRSAFEDSMYGRAVVVVNKEDYTIRVRIKDKQTGDIISGPKVITIKIGGSREKEADFIMCFK